MFIMASGGLSLVTPQTATIIEPSSSYKPSQKSSQTRQTVTFVDPIKSNEHNSGKTASFRPHLKRSYSLSSANKSECQTYNKKRNELNYRKRRYSFNSNESKYKKRRKDAIVLPTKFLLGGNIHDPLNLSSLENDVNQVTPKSSPYPTPKHRTQVEVLIPANINDPLNLNCDEDVDECSLISPKAINNKQRKRKKSEMSGSFDSIECNHTSKDTDKHISDTIDKQHIVKSNSFSKVIDKIVSPVIPQGAGAHSSNKHRRLVDTCKDNSCEHINEHSKQTKSKHKTSDIIKPIHFREKDKKFQYGNYNRYYGYRNTDNQKDKRLENFKKEWFECKNVLDLGCNIGHITLEIAKNFQPNKILGMDIDERLIKIARKNIKHYLNRNANKDVVCDSVPKIEEPLGSTLAINSAKFPNNVFFENGNYVLENDDLLKVQTQEYDCILCLSLTKWIHLNWGDCGLKRMFKRIFAQLKSGGVLVLEAQPWTSYKRKKKLTDITLKNFNTIKFKPDQFNQYLLSNEIGFSKCDLIATPLHSSKGFRRPIYLFTKSSSAASVEKL